MLRLYYDISEAQVILSERVSDHCYIDSHLADESKVKEYVQKYTRAQVQARCKADRTNCHVAGASIIAKKLRDDSMVRLSALVAMDVGSGNLMDPATRLYLKKGHTQGLRKKWSLSSLNSEFQTNPSKRDRADI
jgi:ribonuclease HII